MTNLLDKVIYKSEAMQQMHKEMGPFIDSSASILFWGETGSGMGFYARAIHEASGRTGQFLRIPSFSLDDDTVKQQFLGVDDQPGWLEEADKGTIFLKRISEASSGVQQVLSHLIGNQSVDGKIQFSRKGKTENLEANIRFIFSVAHDFNTAIQDDLLRRDFVDEARKRGKIVHLPPLKNRKEDIINIAKNFFETLNQQYNQNISAIDQSAQNILTNYVWPGNVDELKRVIDEIFSHYAGITTISAEHLPEYVKTKIKGDEYSFKMKDDTKFVGKILSPQILKIKTENKDLRLNTGDLVEIARIEDRNFTPPKFKHFLFKLKDGSQIAGLKILDKKMIVKTSFEPRYQIDPHELHSLLLA